jgi:hypothetical protein
MKKIYLLMVSMLFITACSTDLDQIPPNIAGSDSLTDFEGVLNAAYYYQLSTVTPMAVMAEFRSDNAVMDEAPYTDFDVFNNALPSMEDQFFGPFYTALYRSILSANNVIAKSTVADEVSQAKFLRALSYFKLVKVFGATSVILTPQPTIAEIPTVDLVRKPASDIYNTVIIPDLTDAMAGSPGYAAKALLGKVYMQMGNPGSAVAYLEDVVVNGGYSLESLDGIFGYDNEGNSEIIYSTEVSSSIVDEYTFGSDFWNWFVGDDSKADFPVDPDLVAAFDASDASGGGTDLRRAITLSTDGLTAVKFPKEGDNGGEHDWIEIRLADIVLLHAEALNENTNATGSESATILSLLDDLRTRAGLNSLSGTVSSQADVRQAIADERRLELAFEGHRWFDLVRTGTVDSEMGETVSSNYHVFPVPVSEVLATNGVITQNAGY